MQEYPLRDLAQIPDDVARLAHEQKLGTPQACLSITKLGKGWRWTKFVPLVCLLLAAAFSLISFETSRGPDFFMPYFLLFFIPIYIFVMASLSLSKILNKVCSLYPCDKGFILKFPSSRFRVIRWDEVETVWQTTSRGLATPFATSHLYILRCQDGDVLTFRASSSRKLPYLPASRSMEDVIEEQFTRRRLPLQFANYQDGKTLNFGPLRVSRDGITWQNNLLIWEQVAGISLDKNHLLISQTGEPPRVWARLPALSIPNSSILLALFKQLRGESQPGGEQPRQAPATLITPANRIDPLLAELELLAKEHQLGERRVDQLLGRKRIIGRAGPIALSISFVICAAFFFGIMQFPLNEPYIDGWTKISDFLIFSITLGLGGFFFVTMFVLSMQQLSRATYTFERGLITKYGRQAPVVYRWDEIDNVQQTSFFGNRGANWSAVYGYRLQKRDGSTLTLTAAHMNLLNLASLIREQIVPLQLPETMAALQAEQTLPFGPLQVNKRGIQLGERQLSWLEIQSVRQEMNRLTIYDLAQRKSWANIPVMRVPNMFLLFALADEMRAIPSEAASQTSQEQNRAPLAEMPPVKPFKRDEALSNDPPRRRRVLLAAQVLYVLIAGSLIFLGVSHLSLPTNLSLSSYDVQATQTAQTGMAQATSTVSAGNATAVALETVVPSMSPQAIYQTYTQGKPLFRDPLTNFNETYFYDPDTLKPDPGCVFQKDGLHITSSGPRYWIPCNNSAFPDLMNFSFQYDFSILKGDSAGLRFRARDTKSYYFAIDTAGNYNFIYYPNVMDGTTSQTLQSGTTKQMHKGYGTHNQFTLIAIGNLFYIYLNQQLIMKATDSTLTIGGISLLVDSDTTPTEAVFSQSVAWNIAGMAP